jgi:hypothetical protein
MLRTPHYRLAIFDSGDQYSATWDRRRFTTIDTEMAFISVDMVGDGVVNGWDVNHTSGLNFSVSPGLGIIDGVATFTYGHLLGIVPDNRRSYVWLRRKAELLGDKGAFSPISKVTYTDSGSPTAPATPTGTATTTSVSLSWAENSEPDVIEYDVYRSTDNISFALLGTAAGGTYVDSAVSASTTYYYKLKATDLNGNVSGFGGLFSITTAADSTAPNDPTNVDVNSSDTRLQLVWDASEPPPNHYLVRVQPLDTEGVADGSSYDLTTTETLLLIDGLTNGRRYRLSLYAVSASGVLSNGVVVYGMPGASSGPSGVTNVAVVDFTVDDSFNVGLHITWDVDTNAYTSPPAYYFVTVETGAQRGQPSIYTNTDVTVLQYTIQGDQVARIAEDTSYRIVVQGADSNGNLEPGYHLRFHTRKFSPPAPPTTLVLDGGFTTDTAFVNAQWSNSTTSFSYNLVTVHRVSLDGSSLDLTIDLDKNVGRATAYSVPSSFVVNKARYDFAIVAVDHDGNHSDALTGSVVLNTVFSTSQTTTSGDVVNTIPRPGVPSQQDALPGNGTVTVVWNRYPSDFVTFYNVYRADYVENFEPASFTKVATVPLDTYKWVDYGVENGSSYVYFVTVTDSFFRESLNPSDGFIDYPLSFAVPRSHSSLDEGPAINVTATGYNGSLTWTNSGGGFDGYEIWRSDGNSYSFNKVGDAQAEDEAYTDTNALLQNGDYFYMIRRFRNDGELVVTEENLAPVGAVRLATMVAANGSITVITDLANNIQNLHDPIVAETRRQLAIPHHPYVSSSDDRRIRLAERLVIDDWTTTDFITYTTQSNIKGTSTYNVLVNGDESPISTVIDRENGVLTFAEATFTPPDNKATDGAPVITVVFSNTSEVTGILPAAQIGNISATKVTRGLISHSRLANYDHFGRYRERMGTAQTALEYSGGFSYAATVNDAMTFYDILVATDGRLLAATSRGVCLNNGDGGNTWTVVVGTILPITKLYYSDVYGWYFALAGDTVYYTDNLTNWAPIPGTQGVEIARDITEDASGNVFLSTNSGVFKTNPVNVLKVFWTPTETIDAENPDTYGMMFASGTLTVSTKLGLYETSDAGDTWSKSADTTIFVPVYQFVEGTHSVFAVSNNSIWRLASPSTSYTRVYDSVSPCRKLAILNNVLFVATDAGLFKSSGDVDGSSRVNMRRVAFINRNGNVVAATGIRTVGGRLYIGTDNKLYSLNTIGKLLLHADIAGPAPTIYVNGKVKNVGVSYSDSFVLFDEKLTPLDEVTVTNSYQQLTTPNGGWVNVQYDAPVFLHLNGVLKAAGQPSSLAKEISPSIKAIQLVTFNARNSNFTPALAAMKRIVQIANDIDNLDDNAAVPPSTVAELFNEVDILNANVHPELQTHLVLPSVGGLLKEVPEDLSHTTVAAFTTDPKTLGNSIGTFDAVSGGVDIQTLTIDKYDTVEISIRGVGIINTGTLQHREIEDQFEKVNSGLPASFSFMQQANVLKMGIFNKRYFGNDAGYQSAHFIPSDGWYDRLASTLDYELQVAQEPLGIEIVYPADAVEVSSLGEVWACGKSGVLAINTSTLETRKVFSHEFYILNLAVVGNTVYALATDGLYLVNTLTGSVTKDVEIDLPDASNSIYFINDNTLVGTSSGLLARRPFDIEWHKKVDVLDARVIAGGVFFFCIGKDPDHTSSTKVFYSAGGGSTWNSSATFDDITVNGVTRRFDRIYYATDSGIYVEDLSGLFSNSQFSQAGIDLVDVKGDPDASALVNANDVASDDSRVVIGDSEGMVYVVEGGAVTAVQSLLPTIHKVRMVGGKYWLFGHDLLQIEEAETVVRLSTGKRIT